MEGLTRRVGHGHCVVPPFEIDKSLKRFETELVLLDESHVACSQAMLRNRASHANFDYLFHVCEVHSGFRNQKCNDAGKRIRFRLLHRAMLLQTHELPSILKRRATVGRFKLVTLDRHGFTR